MRNTGRTIDERDVSKIMNWNSVEAKRTNELKAALQGRDSSQKVGLELVEEYRDNLAKLSSAHGGWTPQKKP